MRTVMLWCAIALAALLGGCASLTGPPGSSSGGSPASDAGASADLQMFVNSRAGSASHAQRRPALSFPAVLAVARVQAPGYQSTSGETYGHGAYTVVFPGDDHTRRGIEGLGELARVRRVVELNKLVVPAALHDDRDLRRAAARLHADVLLIYTLGTRIRGDKAGSPADWFTLGLLHDRSPAASTAASALLVDVRTGYLYGLARGHDREQRHTSYWGIDKALAHARRASKRAAFDKLMTDVKRTWAGIVGDYGPKSADNGKPKPKPKPTHPASTSLKP